MNDISKEKEDLLERLRWKPDIFQRCSDIEKDDDDLAFAAISRKLVNIDFVSPRLKGSRIFILKILARVLEQKNKFHLLNDDVLGIHNGHHFLNEINAELLEDTDVCIALMKAWTGKVRPWDQDGFPYSKFHAGILSNPHVAKEAILLNADAFDSFDATIKMNLDLTTMAVIQDPFNYDIADEKIKNDGSLLENVYKKSIGSFFLIRHEPVGPNFAYNFDRVVKAEQSRKGFYASQFKKIDQMIMRNVYKDGDRRTAAQKENILEESMYHVVDRLKQEDIKVLIAKVKSDFGKKVLQDALLKLEVDALPQSSPLSKEKKKRRFNFS